MTAPTPTQGPCTDWISGADVAAVCDLLDFGSDPTVYDNVAHMASELLWAASGRQFGGSCGPITVRPCVPSCGCWPAGTGLGDWGWGWSSTGWTWGAYWLGGGGNGVSAVQDCGPGGGCCGSLSRVKLHGYPVTEILEVKIDGDVISPVNYRLDEWKYLTYLNTPGTRACYPIFAVNAAMGLVQIEGDHFEEFEVGSTITISGSSGNDGTYEVQTSSFSAYTDILLTTSLAQDVADGAICTEPSGGGDPQRWPACQNLARDDDQPGTFSVTYLFGTDPPEIGLEAAAELACALVRAGGGDCELPAGVTRVERQGLTIDLILFRGMLPPGLGALPLTQAFLRAYNPAGLTRRSSLYTPDLAPFAQKLG